MALMLGNLCLISVLKYAFCSCEVHLLYISAVAAVGVSGETEYCNRQSNLWYQYIS